MLKIKNNIDLKELEKYGFKKEGNEYISNTCVVQIYDEIYQKENTRILFALTGGYLDTIYDLIQAGLVEKV